MPGPQVKDWKVYEDCMRDKEKIGPNKEYCAKVANAVAARSVRHSDVPMLVQWGVELAMRDVRRSD